MKCPICGSENVERVEVDIGVGIQVGPWQCHADPCVWQEYDDIVDASFDESKTGSNDHRALSAACDFAVQAETTLALVEAAVRHLSDSGVDVDSLPLDRSLLDDIERVIFADDPESEADRIAQEHSDLAWSMVEP